MLRFINWEEVARRSFIPGILAFLVFVTDPVATNVANLLEANDFAEPIRMDETWITQQKPISAEQPRTLGASVQTLPPAVRDLQTTKPTSKPETRTVDSTGARPTIQPQTFLVGLYQDSSRHKTNEPETRQYTISVYSSYYNGRKMSNGKPYDPNKFTVASNDYKLGTKLSISYKGKTVKVVVTDRMAKRFSGIRVDASMAVWKALGGGKPGLLKGATVEVVK